MTICRPKRTMRKLSLFSGIGGLDLAAKLAGMETIAFCEREAFPCKVLAHRFPGVPIYDDVRTLTAAQLRKDGIIGYGKPLDLLSAGYPCQPFSSAGKRLGEADDRHLWPEVARLLYELRPTWFIGENVAGHVSMGLDDVLSDLASIGYEARVFLIPACAVGAPHRRDRIFIVGYTDIPPEWSLDANRRADELDQATEAEQLKQLFTDHIGTHVDWEKTIAAHLGEAGAVKQPDIATRFRAATQDVADAIGFPGDRTIDHQPECQIAPNEFNGSSRALDLPTAVLLQETFEWGEKAALNKLNPALVEPLMGFPIGWTDLSGPLPWELHNTTGNLHEPYPMFPIASLG